MPQFACTTVQCNPHALSNGVDPIEFVPCGTICVADAPRMVNASFADSGDRIEVGEEEGACGAAFRSLNDLFTWFGTCPNIASTSG